ncbi:MAG: T9SS type A sorting domain-containing protein [Ignavibacteria bacterium]|nr:T9SS type A sorting domain-containing protein [Ignavibacteria bacterium]
MKHLKIKFAVLFLLTVISMSIYPQVPLSDFMPANGVLGTTDFVTNTNYAAPSTTTLAEPFCVAIDPTTGKLFVADRDNRRILRWSSANKMINGSAAEVVFGQPDFVTRTANTGGISAATMNNPNSVYVDANGTLWVADRDNHRVLKFNNASSKLTGANADGVLGQPNFTSNTSGTTAGLLKAPTSVFVDGSGRLWVADKDNNRVMRFDNASAKPNGSNADGVLGQANFTTGTSGLSASTMSAPWGVYADVTGKLWVADRSNNRVLRFDNAAGLANGSVANGVLGQTDFVTGTSGLTQSKFDGPRGTFLDGMGRLYVGDEGNSRVIVFTNAAAKPNGANADNVLGQPDFITTGGVTSQTGLNYPSTVFIDNANNHIWIPDTYSHRILRYDVSPLPVELTSFTAVSQDQQVTLNWRTATELNNSGFEIQRSVANSEFATVGFVKGMGTTTIQQDYSFSDKNLSNGSYTYRLKQIDFNGQFEYSNEVEVDVISIDNYSLIQNYPNPFNPSTKIGYILKDRTNVKVVVMNSLGEEIAVLSNEVQDQGFHELEFNAANLSSGIYFYSIQTMQYRETKKMILMK